MTFMCNKILKKEQAMDKDSFDKKWNAAIIRFALLVRFKSFNEN